MAQVLTTPENKTIETQGVTAMVFDIPHVNALLDKPNISLIYEVTSWTSTGEVVSKVSRSVAFPSWPASFKTDMASVYSKVEQDAVASGLIGLGTPEAL